MEASDDQTPELDKEELKMALSNAQEKINRLETDRDRLQQQKMSLEEVLEMQKKEQTDMYEHSLREVLHCAAMLFVCVCVCVCAF